MSLSQTKKELLPDCERCEALCCTVTKFTAGDYKKAAGVTCRNLDHKCFECKIYDTRQQHGYAFCLNFNCYGVGQAVTTLFNKLGYDCGKDNVHSRIRNDIFKYTYKFIRTKFPLGIISNKNKIVGNGILLKFIVPIQLIPLVEEATNILSEEINEKL